MFKKRKYYLNNIPKKFFHSSSIVYAPKPCYISQKNEFPKSLLKQLCYLKSHVLSIILEIHLKALLKKRIKYEMFNILWAYHVYILPLKRKYKHFKDLSKI